MDKTGLIRSQSESMGLGWRWFSTEAAAIVMSLWDMYKNKGCLKIWGWGGEENSVYFQIRFEFNMELIQWRRDNNRHLVRIRYFPILTLYTPVHSSYSVVEGHQGSTGFNSIFLRLNKGNVGCTFRILMAKMAQAGGECKHKIPLLPNPSEL